MQTTSKKLMCCILLTTISLFSTANFWTTIRKEMGDAQLFLMNANGLIFDRLPETAKNTGKKIQISIPNCKADTVVRIIFPGIQDIGSSIIFKIITLTPKNNSAVLTFPTPFSQKDDTILITIFPKTKAYTNYSNFIKTHDLAKLSKEESAQFNRITKLFYQDQRPEHAMKFNYKDLSSNQVLKLPYPAAHKIKSSLPANLSEMF